MCTPFNPLKCQLARWLFFMVSAVMLFVGPCYGESLAWTTEAGITTGSTAVVSEPRMAVDPNGKVMAVWVQSDGVAQSIYAKQGDLFDGLPGILLENSSSPTDSPRIAGDGNGNFIAVWRQAHPTGSGDRYGLYASRNDGHSWSAPVMVYADFARDDVTANPDFQLVVDPNGNAVVAWSVYDWSWNHTSVRAIRYVVGTGWTGYVNLSTESVQQAFSPNVAVDATGNAIVVWTQNVGTSSSLAGVFAANLTAGTSWGAAALIGTSYGNWDGVSPQVAFDASGNALVVWTDYPKPGIRSNRYVPGTGWTGEASVADPGTPSYDEGVRLAFDKNGNAIAVWNQSGGVLYGNRYVAGTGWGTTAILESNGGDYAEQIAIDPKGNALALWANYACNSRNIQATRYVLGVGWDATRRCYEGAFSVNTSLDNAGSPQLVIDGTGKAIALWVQSGELFVATTTVAPKQTQTIGAISFAPTTVLVGNTVAASASASSGLAVVLSTNTPTVCTVNAQTVTALAAGTCTIAADQAGDANHVSATQVLQSIEVGIGSQAIAFGVAPTLGIGVSGSVSAIGGVSGNAVIFTSLTPAVCVLSGGTVTALTGGRCVIAANQAGNANYGAALQATQVLMVPGVKVFLGWNLLGNNSDQDINVVTLFGDKTTPTGLSANTITVWAWDAKNAQWAFFTPAMTAAELVTYAQVKGYQVLQTIAARQGFWLNSKSESSLP
jgi:hypothetical protein